MTTIPTTLRHAALGFAASLLAGTLLIGSAPRGFAAEAGPLPVSATAASQSQRGPASTNATIDHASPAPGSVEPIGIVGFGWG